MALALSFVFALIAALGFYAPAASAQANVTGTWQTLPNLMPINPVHTALMHNGQILVVSGSGNYPQQTVFYVGIWDPSTGTFINQQTQAWDEFCGAMVQLPDGRPMTVGGNLQYDPFHGWNRSMIYDPATGKYSDMEDMVYGRWYPTTTILGDGRMMTWSGLDVNGNTDAHVEIYKVGVGWGAPSASSWTPPLYPRAHLLPNGKVFYSGATTQSRYFDPSNNTWSAVIATTNYSGTRTYGSSVLFPLTPANNYKPQVIIFGGNNPSVNTTEIIDLSAATPKWVYGPNMSEPRIEMNATMLPNGKILALGGSLNDEDTSSASLQADLYDTATNTMSVAGSEAFARVYHSVSLLMPDGTVWVAGGNPVRGTYEQHVEVYTPPYLYNSSGVLATRPSITSVSNSVIGYGTSFTVTTPDAANISSVVLMKNGSVTHAFNMDQRMVGLNFTKGSGVLTVTGPPNGNIAPPGWYMLFLLNSSGVPAVAKFVQVSLTPTDTAPKGTITSPASDITIAPGQSVTFAGTGTGTISAYSWSFRGASPAKSSLANPGAVTFATAGTYTAEFTVTDAAGQTDQSPATRVITVATVAAPTLTSASPNSGTQGATVSNIVLTGTNFLTSPTCNFGTGVTVNSCVYNSATKITASVTIGSSAATGARNVTVTDTDGQIATLTNGFTVNAAVIVPTVTSVNPNSGTQGATLSSVAIAGTNFATGASCSFGTGITVNSCAFNSATSMTANLTITASAATGARTVTVTNTSGQTGSLTSGFTVNAPAAPTVTSVSPSGGVQGATLASVVIGGTNFASGATCSFGTGITVNSCAFNSATQMNANLTIAASASTGARTVTVTNTSGQAGSLTNGFSVNAAPAPTVTSVNPSSGTQGATLSSVVIGGTNFASGATCSFGAGITVNSCAFNSATQMTASVTIAASAATGARTVTVTNTSGQAGSATNGFTVNQASSGGGTQQINFTYADRTGLLADGWDFNAKTAAGATRNTEQTGTVAISYDQTGHPGVIRMPIPIGDIYGATNNSQNQLNRNLPSNWTSARLNISAFAPTVNYEEVSIVAYQDDDNFVLLGRMYDGTPTMEFYQETAGTPAADAGFKTLTNTGNLILRIDFNSATNVYTAFYSTDGGNTWVANGSITRTLTAPRLAIVVGANYAGTLPTADLSWVQVITPGMAAAPTLTAVNPNTGAQASTLSSVVLTGTNFLSGPTCSFGAGITVNSCAFNSASQLTANITIAASAATGSRTVTVTDSDGQVATLASAFTVTAATATPPTVTSASPNTGAQGASLASVVIGGSNFASGASCSFGAGITTNSCTFASATQMTASLSISASAATGTRTVTVTNPNGQSGSLASGFTVTAATGGTSQYNFTYANRSAFVADGWDFNGKTAAGATRNTEQTGTLAVSYDQTAHNGTMRLPIPIGDIYGATNNSENMLMRDLPSTWTSIRLNISAFAPTVNYEEVSIAAYQDDDNFVLLGRMYDGTPTMEFYQETAGTPANDAGFSLLTNTGNLILRIDRSGTTYSAFYSTDGGSTWIADGTLTRTLTNPRLAIVVGANYAGTLPTADLSWVQVVTP